MNELILKRRSIRKYDISNPATKEQLTQLLEAAMLSPSTMNTRPWEFIVITKREILDELAKMFKYAKSLTSATAAIVVVAIPKAGEAEGYSPLDCSVASQSIMLEAVSQGLGSCWCGVYPMEDRVTALADFLKIESPKIPFNIIAVGVPAEEPKQRGFYEESRVTFIE